MRTLLQVACVAGGLALSLCCMAQSPSPESRTAAMLAKRFESVFVVRNPERAKMADRLLLALLDHALKQNKTMRGIDPFAKEVRSIIVGGRGFRAPRGLGSTRSNTCYIVESQSAVRLLARRGSESLELVSDVTPFRWHAQMGEGLGTEEFWVARWSWSAIVICNDRQEISELFRAQKSPMELAVPLNSAATAALEKSSFWGYRRIRHNESSVAGAAGGFPFIDSTVSELYAFRGLKTDDMTLVVNGTQLSADVLGRLAASFPEPPKITASSWSTAIPMRGEHANESLLRLMGLMGFGIYL